MLCEVYLNMAQRADFCVSIIGSTWYLGDSLKLYQSTFSTLIASGKQIYAWETVTCSLQGQI